MERRTDVWVCVMQEDELCHGQNLLSMDQWTFIQREWLSGHVVESRIWTLTYFGPFRAKMPQCHMVSTAFYVPLSPGTFILLSYDNCRDKLLFNRNDPNKDGKLGHTHTCIPLPFLDNDYDGSQQKDKDHESSSRSPKYQPHVLRILGYLQCVIMILTCS